MSSLYQGKLFGILINATYRPDHERYFGAITKFIEECATLSHDRGIRFVVVHPNNINLANATAIGHYKVGDSWRVGRCSIPHILYNRILTRTFEKQPHICSLLKSMREDYGVKLFNERFLDKLEVHNLLVQNEDVLRFLPETMPFDVVNLDSLLTQHGSVYIKPINGSLGEGIMSVVQNQSMDRRSWTLKCSVQMGNIAQEVSTFAELVRLLQQRIGRRKYIVQQALDLVYLHNRPLDFRVLLQRDGIGEWQVTSCVGRLTNSDNIVSNLAQGATIRKASEVLTELDLPLGFNIEHLKQVSLELVKAFDAQIEGHFAELGLDLAIDSTGRVWMIELNSKPSKNSNTVVNKELAIRPSVYKLLDYVRYLD